MDTIVRIPAALRSLTAGADEVKAACPVTGCQCGAGPEPDKMPIGMAHAEFMVEAFGAVFHEIAHEAIKGGVMLMHEGRDIGGGQPFVAG